MGFFAKLKAVTQMVFSNVNPWTFLLPRTKFDYARAVGDGQGSSVIMAPVLWIARTFPEAPVAIEKNGEIEHEHDMLKLLAKPNEFYSGLTLWMATLISFVIGGNAYWIKIRNNQLKPIALWYVPHWMIEPKWSDKGDDYISHYLYNPGGEAIPVEVADVVHFRYGLDPRNIRKGLSPLGSVMREVFTDDEAANFSASILKNMGIPGLIISPAKDSVAMPGDKEAVKEAYKEKFSGDRRGEPLVMGAATEVKVLSFSPKELDLGALRNLPEERVTAVLGIPAAVVGFGTGLQQTKVGATMSELREMAYESCIIPLQRLLTSELDNQLLPDFETDLKNTKTIFDNTNVRVLQEDQNKLATRLNVMVKGGWILVSEAQRRMGMEVDDSQNIYLRSFNMIEVPEGTTQPAFDTGGQDKAVKWFLPAGLKNAEWLRQLTVQFVKDNIQLSGIFAVELIKGFNGLAKAAIEIWEQIAIDYDIDYSRETRATIPELKQQEEIYVDLFDTSMVVDGFIDYKPHYLRVSKRTVDTINTIVGLGINLPDQSEIRIIAESAKRFDLLDLKGQVKESVFRAITEAREEGLGPPATARRIKDMVSSGPWSTPEIRSRVIARTETKYAQNVSSIEAYKAADTVNEVRIVDGQLSTSDDFCISRNGDTISFAEAEVLAEEEHPNGTLSFSPIVG